MHRESMITVIVTLMMGATLIDWPEPTGFVKSFIDYVGPVVSKLIYALCVIFVAVPSIQVALGTVYIIYHFIGDNIFCRNRRSVSHED